MADCLSARQAGPQVTVTSEALPSDNRPEFLEKFRWVPVLPMSNQPSPIRTLDYPCAITNGRQARTDSPRAAIPGLHHPSNQQYPSAFSGMNIGQILHF
jgi:hypothetical protein